MTRTIERDVTSYLRSEADRVAIHDSLADIEDGVTLVSVTPSIKRANPAPLWIAVAASIVAVLAMIASRDTLSSGAPAGHAVVTFDAVTTPTIVKQPTTSSATESSPPTTVPPARVPLPAGAELQGLTPSCTTVDGIEYDCTLEEYAVPLGDFDMTGYVIEIVDDTSHVSGGCRSASADALTWRCYVGQRAVEEEIVAAGFLGDWAPRGYIAG